MKNYIKDFSQFQRINEVRIMNVGTKPTTLASEAMAKLVLANINSGLDMPMDDSNNSSWITSSTPECKNKMKEIFGDISLAVIHEFGLEIQQTSNGLVASIEGMDKELELPLKEVSDTKTKYLDRLANGDDDFDTIDITVFTFDDGSNLAQVWIGDGFHAPLPYLIGPDFSVNYPSKKR